VKEFEERERVLVERVGVEPGSFVRRRQREWVLSWFVRSSSSSRGCCCWRWSFFCCGLCELLGLPRRHVPKDGRRASGVKDVPRASPWLPRRHVPQGPEGASGPQGKSPLFLFIWGLCVSAVRPRPLK